MLKYRLYDIDIVISKALQYGCLAQSNRVYDDYLAELAGTKPGDLAVSAVSIIGPRNKVAKLVKNLSLLG